MSIEIKCTKEQQINLGSLLSAMGFNEEIEWKIIEMGYITDEEIDAYGKFTDSQKEIIKKMYAEYPKGFFPNPMCALY